MEIDTSRGFAFSQTISPAEFSIHVSKDKAITIDFLKDLLASLIRGYWHEMKIYFHRLLIPIVVGGRDTIINTVCDWPAQASIFSTTYQISFGLQPLETRRFGHMSNFASIHSNLLATKVGEESIT